jgi:hypothetical protein
MSQTRRLAAILAADVAGYSRLIGADESGTLERLRALRRELLDPKIAEHRGRLVKTTGDGLLVEFGSVVDALRCAVEVQRELTGRNTSVLPDNRIELRIVVFCELGKNRVGANAGMKRDIGVDEISRDRATPLIPPAQRNFGHLLLFDARGLWHAAQGGHRILQPVAGAGKIVVTSLSRVISRSMSVSA